MITLVLLPGMDGTAELFAPFLRALGSRLAVQVVRYPTTETLGYGDLEHAVRQTLPTDGPFAILGESFSGPIAVALAASRPSGLQAVILCCSFTERPRPWLGRLVAPLLSIPIPIISVLSLMLMGRHANKELRNALRTAFTSIVPDVLRFRLASALRVDMAAELRRVEVPLLYLQATEDLVVPRSAARKIRKLCPQTEVVSISGPHLLLQVRPDECAAVITRFLAGIEKTALSK